MDESLLIEAAQKDPSRFAELYEANVDRVYAYIARRVQDRAAAEDLTSEVFHSALANLGKFMWRGAPFASWLYRIAAHAIADRWQQSRHNVSEVLPENLPGGVEEIERRAMLFQLVDQLPEDQRRVIIGAFCGTETNSGNRRGDGTQRRRYKAASVPGAGDTSGTYGESQCLNALSLNNWMS